MVRIVASVASAAWPVCELAELLKRLANHAGLPLNVGMGNSPPPDDLSIDELNTWIATMVASLGGESLPVRVRYRELKQALQNARNAIARLPSSPPSFLALLHCRGNICRVLNRDGEVTRLPIADVRDALLVDLEGPLRSGIDALLRELPRECADEDALRSSLLHRHLDQQQLDMLWTVDISSAASLQRRFARERIPIKIAAFVGLYTLQYGLWLLSWWTVAEWVIHGHAVAGMIIVWILLLSTVIPAQLLCNWLQGSIAIHAGTILKERMLLSAMRFDADRLRMDGPSRLLARVLEAHVIDNALVNGVFSGLTSLIEMVFAAAILTRGVASWHAVVLLAFAAFFGACCFVYFRMRTQWTAVRLLMTHTLVERMVGYRTRIAQEQPEHWHDGEDDLLSRYVELSSRMDRVGELITPLPWHGWIVVSLAALTVSAAIRSFDPTRVAITIGGIVIAGRAFTKWVLAFLQLCDAGIAAQQMRAFLRTTIELPRPGIPELAARRQSAATDAPVLKGYQLVFGYPHSPEPVIRHWSLDIRSKDRLLIEGPSGGGKSTLGALLAGLREPSSGTLLLGGLDRFMLGTEAWRRRVVIAPQFHENFIFAESFAFNLLMGRRWPPRRSDLDEAMTVCHELGLRDLLRKMPGGILQMIGETGWQLSHGERSRVYIARALLQHPDILILDESFAALDPESFDQAMTTVLKHAKALVVIAHP